ncbi:ATP-binding protein [Streptomyces sp. NBC_00536]|uniref:ATP-binding protein n=1 Tax=Streptomyces sp. NBC_00536 TaxID=2975769 RepID=UPI002E817929|nr:ATP-binding protein [Streptomyces sp. NBC_00536]WUC79998.1 ATP-binding protein [Streptomyces sp. NBC_00536]
MGEPEQTRRLVLGGPVPGVVTRCRDFTRRALTEWRWLPSDGSPAAVEAVEEAAEDVLLMVSELVTNACMHAGGPGALVLRHTADGLRMEVSDGSPEHPRRRSPGNPSVPGGHGLIVLERLSREWGWERNEAVGGKTVWAEVASPLAPPTDGPSSGGTAS